MRTTDRSAAEELRIPAADEGREQLNRWLNRTVGGAGLASALGDFCYETATVILPGFLAVLGVPAAALGIIEGAADALASFTKMISGFIADKFGNRKLLVAIGYGLTPIGQMLIAVAAGWQLLLIGRLVSWFGKGLRGPLRDAIVTQAVTPRTRGRAFGFHRAMDTVGAVAGPLLGVGLIGWAKALLPEDPTGPFRFVFWVSLLPGALAVAAFLAMVKDPGHSPNPGLEFIRALKDLPTRFKRFLGAAGTFGMGDFSHTMLVMAATQLLTPAMGVVPASQAAGMLYAWRNIVQVLMSYPVGALADRCGSMPVLTVGYLLGALTGAATALVLWLDIASLVLLSVVFFMAGLCMAVQEALESTLTADLVDHRVLAMSYGALGAVNGTSKFVSSSLLGVLWTLISPVFGFGFAAALMALGAAAMAANRKPFQG